MTARRALNVLYLVIVIQICHCDFSFKLKADVSHCISEDVDKGEMVSLSFQLEPGSGSSEDGKEGESDAKQSVVVAIMSPNEKETSRITVTDKSETTFTAEKSGAHFVCFRNEGKSE
eukprot:394549_1